jgi:23S rRNA (cytidine1920-2'-O)/16S rRNA (cytidine1409-2'-O)-methyltransferase
MKENALVVALIKPQFEAPREEVGKGGIVRDATVRKRVRVPDAIAMNLRG